MIPDELIQQINQWLHENSAKNDSIIKTEILTGGCINDCHVLYTNKKKIFLKYNLASRFPEMLAAESQGLILLKKSQLIGVPEVLYSGETASYSFLLLEYIPEGHNDKDFWEKFGRQLARLHRMSQTSFGLDYNNYIGSIPQKNSYFSQWNEFVIVNRLQPLVRKAYNKKLLNHTDISDFDRLFTRIENILPAEKPALLHGDLWSGNFIMNVEGQPILIDPSVYFGHREMDIAMTRLFGGFSNDFYHFYNDEYPLEKGWKNRVEFNQLYPLLVHVLLFGSTYASQIRNIIRKY
ncbi:MAG: fructosamine kinase family protein [Lentimicrobium sp.]|jgi:fructosamine-3-kinase|nr:fructosamine kinase family protein [Lentimicrobium sp.]